MHELNILLKIEFRRAFKNKLFAASIVIGLALAAGAFIQGSSIELSADGPLKEPYAVYFQGGLTWYHAKYGIMMALEKLVQAGIVTL